MEKLKALRQIWWPITSWGKKRSQKCTQCHKLETLPSSPSFLTMEKLIIMGPSPTTCICCNFYHKIINSSTPSITSQSTTLQKKKHQAIRITLIHASLQIRFWRIHLSLSKLNFTFYFIQKIIRAKINESKNKQERWNRSRQIKTISKYLVVQLQKDCIFFIIKGSINRKST